MLGEVKLTFPVAELAPDALIVRHLEVGQLSKEQATALRALREGARATNLRLANGKHVESNSDVLRALLENSYSLLKPAAFSTKR